MRGDHNQREQQKPRTNESKGLEFAFSLTFRSFEVWNLVYLEHFAALTHLMGVLFETLKFSLEQVDVDECKTMHRKTCLGKRLYLFLNQHFHVYGW